MNTNLKGGAVAAIAICVLACTALPSHAGEQRFDNRHPRRSQVLDRSANLNHRINANKGNLDGHYNQLKREDNAIRKQQQRDARNNGGHITRGEQAKLNREENRVNNQIKRDK